MVNCSHHFSTHLWYCWNEYLYFRVRWWQAQTKLSETAPRIDRPYVSRRNCAEYCAKPSCSPNGVDISTSTSYRRLHWNRRLAPQNNSPLHACTGNRAHKDSTVGTQRLLPPFEAFPRICLPLFLQRQRLRGVIVLCSESTKMLQW